MSRFLTTSFRECREYILDETGTHKFALGDLGQFSRFEHCAHSVGRLSLHSTDMQCRTGFEMSKTARSPYYAFQFILEGECHLDGVNGRYVAGPGDVFVLGPQAIVRERWPDKCQQYILRIDEEWIDQAIAVELNRSLKRRVSFEPVARDPGIAAWLRRIADDLAAEGSGALLENARVARDIERSVITMIVTALRHSETEELQNAFSGVAPFYVKRAEAFIREHAREDLSIEDIARCAGVSNRTLFYGFKRWRNSSPMAYLRDTRLDLARAELENSRGGGGKVSEAAINAGFTNFGQFSRIYKARFGETPSATIRLDR